MNAENITYIPISTDEIVMEPYLSTPFPREVFEVYKSYYPRIGHHPPWIGYFAVQDGVVVGVGGFKGQPMNNQVEIAYGTDPGHEGKGISTLTCQFLTQLAAKEQSNLRITARTLMEPNASTRILKKNGYQFCGVVNDPEDGDVWEWEYNPTNA